jgi:2-amino-4-hydroxy-6-hydroxymethyldihydropteridine diphosphokinase
MSRAVLSLGSNLGDRYGHLRRAVAGLGDTVLVVSGVYETRPWLPTVAAMSEAAEPEQPPYLNAVALVADAGATACDWLARTRALEQVEGRVRDPARRFGARTLDIDVITVWSEQGEPIMSGDPALTLPHPRAHLRAFVLRPWLDIQPYAQLPGHGWIFDLVRTEPVASDLAGLTARPDLHLG